MMAIDSKSLMLGDWVRRRWTCSDTGRGVVKDSQVTEIRKNGETLYAWSKNGNIGRVENLEPIPLTPEILEKNGFKKQSDYQWEYCDNSCRIVISIAPQIEIDGEMLGTPPINVNLEGALFDINMTSDMCVHSLQHALRLCGIDKEITI